ncbi:RNA exonuclease 4-like [Papaver somniferum]|uniref:RNA exonuclease 4-like n=1 Tax=Papaver somniferum TaxID=3469 RepID=UPI000E700A0B|nr:RNA exonuclease 4-like [Papaver somniferum]
MDKNKKVCGPLPKVECARVFSARGCNLCLTILNGSNAVDSHRKTCQFSRTNLGSPNDILSQVSNLGINSDGKTRGPQAFALACKMVGGGSDGSLNLCARVCLIDEDQRIILQAYVKPLIPVTNYRDSNAMQLRDVQKIIQDFLCNGEPIWKIGSSKGTGKARILVGHDLECLGMEYPSNLIRDTAKYPPLMKTSKLSNSLKYLAKDYLGYDIQTGIQDPFEDSVATMRLYKRMRNLNHKVEDVSTTTDAQNRNSNNFASWRQNDLERMTLDQLLAISTSDYHCWCLDSK